MTDSKAYIVVDVGGTYLKSAVMNSEGEVLRGSSCMAEAHSEGSQAEVIDALTNSIVNEYGFIKENNYDISGIGLTFPGPFDYFQGVPLMEHKFKSLYKINLEERLRNIPEVGNYIPISFRHDANSMLAGELWRGNADGYPNSAVVTLGTGLGFAFSINGVVQCNPIGGPLITIFRIPYKDGILEDYTSKRGFLRLYKEYSKMEDIEGIEVSDIGK